GLPRSSGPGPRLGAIGRAEALSGTLRPAHSSSGSLVVGVTRRRGHSSSGSVPKTYKQGKRERRGSGGGMGEDVEGRCFAARPEELFRPRSPAHGLMVTPRPLTA